jgi:hypothetical protein
LLFNCWFSDRSIIYFFSKLKKNCIFAFFWFQIVKIPLIRWQNPWWNKSESQAKTRLDVYCINLSKEFERIKSFIKKKFCSFWFWQFIHIDMRENRCSKALNTNIAGKEDKTLADRHFTSRILSVKL